MTIELTGENFIGNQRSSTGSDTFRAENRLTGVELEPSYRSATEGEVQRAAQLASQAALPYASLTPEQRANFLESIADQIEALGDGLLARANLETALPLARLTGERGRTTGQLRMFAKLIREGSWVEARIDEGDPDRPAIPKPDLRRMLVALGPVAVFGASNFPFAFSVAGGDTASALAAGCPVVVKAHPSHPGTSELVASAVLAAAQATDMPEGVFSMVFGGAEVGTQLVEQPEIEAVGFTGSLAAGRALFDLAASRPRPIPVYAEMGSVNPIFVLPNALSERSEAIAAGYATSLTAGVGQFCTNPGIIVGIEGPAFSQFLEQVATAIRAVAPGTMLNQGITRQYQTGTAHRSGHPALKALVSPGPGDITPGLFTTTGADFLAHPELAEELFGPSAIAVTCSGMDEIVQIARALKGQLTATVQFASEDEPAAQTLFAELVPVAGRLIANGFPTGVEVNPSMQHGGPYPASTDTRSTSVGTAAISRFARPVSYQGMPAGLLPTALRDENPLGILRLVNGTWTREAITK